MPPATHFAALPSGYLRPLAEWTVPLPFIQHSELPVDTGSASIACDDRPGKRSMICRLCNEHLSHLARATGRRCHSDRLQNEDRIRRSHDSCGRGRAFQLRTLFKTT